MIYRMISTLEKLEMTDMKHHESNIQSWSITECNYEVFEFIEALPCFISVEADYKKRKPNTAT